MAQCHWDRCYHGRARPFPADQEGHHEGKRILLAVPFLRCVAKTAFVGRVARISRPQEHQFDSEEQGLWRFSRDKVTV